MSFDTVLHLVTVYGYFFIFLLMIVEGPIITIVSSFAAALGLYNIYTIFVLALVGNMIPDLVYYAIGMWGRKSFIDKHKKLFGFTRKHLAKFEKLSTENLVKHLLVIKLIPFFAMPGLITAGALKIKFAKYLKWISIIIFFNSLFYLLIGYYFGATYKFLEGLPDFKIYLRIVLIIIGIGVVYGYKKAIQKMVKRIEE